MSIRQHIFIALLFNHLAQAEIEISGQVVNASNEPLMGVNIYVEGSYDGSSSDMHGEFRFATDLNGEQTLIVSFIGYQSFEKEVNLNANLHLKIVLQEKINRIDGVTITAGAFEASDVKKSVVLRTLDIITTAGATADITGVMNTLPGTQTVGEEGKLFVRGGAGHEAKTFINGLLVADPFTIAPQNIPSRFRYSPFLFKGAYFSTGGYSAEYGQALSSVLQLQTHNLPNTSQTDVSLMSIGADISQTILKNNTSFYGQVQYTDLAGCFSLLPQRYDWEKAPNALNATMHLKHKYGQIGEIMAYVNYDRSSMKLKLPKPGRIDELIQNDINSCNLYSNVFTGNSLNESISFRGGVSYSVNTNKVLSDANRINTREETLHTKWIFDHELSDHIFIKYGAEWIANSYQEILAHSGLDSFQRLSFLNNLLSPFTEADIYFNNKLLARIGARYEFNDLIRSHTISPRISLAYKLLENSQISLAYGKFTQLPLAEYLKWTRDLKPENASHYILNYQFEKAGQVFRSEIYYKKYDQLVTTENIGSGIYLDNNGYGHAKGIELFWRDSKTFQYVDYWISYSFLNTERKYDIFPYPVIPYFASRHNLSVVYKHFLKFLKSQVGWTYSFTSPRPYTDPNTGKYNNRITKSYNDFSVNWSYLVKPNIIIHASISNIFGFNNVFGYQFNDEVNSEGIYESVPIEPQTKRFVFLGFFITLSKDKNANIINNL